MHPDRWITEIYKSNLTDLNAFNFCSIQLISHVESLTCTVIFLKSRQLFVFSCLVHYSIAPLGLWSSTWLIQVILQNFHKSEIKIGSLTRNKITALESPDLQTVAGDNDAVSFHRLPWTLVVKKEWLLFYKDFIYSNTSWMLMHPYLFFCSTWHYISPLLCYAI